MVEENLRINVPTLPLAGGTHLIYSFHLDDDLEALQSSHLFNLFML